MPSPISLLRSGSFYVGPVRQSEVVGRLESWESPGIIRGKSEGLSSHHAVRQSAVNRRGGGGGRRGGGGGGGGGGGAGRKTLARPADPAPCPHSPRRHPPPRPPADS